MSGLNVIDAIRPIRFIGEADPAPSPVPRGPYDRLIPALDGLVDYVMPYPNAASAPCIVVRVFGRMNEAGPIVMRASYAGSTPTHEYTITDDIMGHPMAYMCAFKDIPTGVNDLVIQCTRGSAGLAALRIGDVVSYDSFGYVDYIFDDSRTLEFTMLPEFPGQSRFGLIAGWMNDSAAPVAGPAGATQQWSVSQGGAEAGMAAWFGDRPSINAGGDTFRYTANAAAMTDWGLALAVEIEGLVLP